MFATRVRFIRVAEDLSRGLCDLILEVGSQLIRRGEVGGRVFLIHAHEDRGDGIEKHISRGLHDVDGTIDRNRVTDFVCWRSGETPRDGNKRGTRKA